MFYTNQEIDVVDCLPEAWPSKKKTVELVREMCEWMERGKENRWEEIEGKRKLGSSRNKASKVGWNIVVEAIVVNLKGKKRYQ